MKGKSKASDKLKDKAKKFARREAAGELGAPTPRGETDLELAKSEAVRLLFDFPEDRLQERTEIPDRMIISLSMMEVCEGAFEPPENGEKPERLSKKFRYSFYRHMLSRRRQLRKEGLIILEAAEEEKEDMGLSL